MNAVETEMWQSKLTIISATNKLDLDDNDINDVNSDGIPPDFCHAPTAIAWAKKQHFSRRKLNKSD